MTRGAIYGNFKNKEELFLELVASRWKPIVPPLDSTAGFREHMRALGRAVAAEARAREAYAAAATSFQLYVLTHKAMQAQLTKQNAIVYRKMAEEVIKHIPEKSLPMPAPQFVRVLDALISGLLFTYFQTPSLIGEEVFVSAFEAFAR